MRGLGHLIKLIRAHKGLNQNRMAELLGISQNYLSLIESKKKQPSYELVNHMASVLKISSDALVFATSDIPVEFSPNDKNNYKRLQDNITKLLLFELTGELEESA